ncbi:hypothetical protein F2Q70_00015051 [Brassica cretica]|uniref:Uncharacterized protein n=1 Tax=Brassica cretica TaxID=69181 RepID=A0A8S9HU58_BRACR|nr:hypothetical protein F2Q70_00015051 [Brassica cretica]
MDARSLRSDRAWLELGHYVATERDVCSVATWQPSLARARSLRSDRATFFGLSPMSRVSSAGLFRAGGLTGRYVASRSKPRRVLLVFVVKSQRKLRLRRNEKRFDEDSKENAKEDFSEAL